MNELAELEQAERIKKWCRDYGVAIVVGLILVIVASLVWQHWKQRQENHLVKASQHYESLVDASMQQDNRGTMVAISKNLLQNYPQTPYASLAALQLAKQAVIHKQLAEAENKLNWVIKQGKNVTLRAVARARLARVLLSENQPARALEVLNQNDNKAYQSLIFEEKGDIFLRLGSPQKALQNYLEAKKLYSENSIEQPLLSMKINNLTLQD